MEEENQEIQPPRYAIFDFETSQNKRSNKVIEIAILILEEESSDQAKIVDSYNTLINPETKVSDEALEQLDITIEELNSAPTFATVAEDLAHFFDGTTLISYQISDKVKQLTKEFKKAGITFKPETLDIEKDLKKELKNTDTSSLDEVCDHYGIQKSSHHKAINNAVATLEVFQNFHYQINTNNGVEISYSRIHAAHPGLDLKSLAKLSYRPGLLQLYSDGKPLFVERFESLAREVPKYLIYFKNEYGEEVDSIQMAQFHDPLIALLKKEERIRRLKPSLNYQQRKVAWGVFHSENPFDLKIEPLLKGKGTLLHYAESEEDAERWINIQKQVATQDEYTYIDMEDKKLMARLKKEREKLVRAKIKPLLEYPHDDFVVMGPGRDDDELSCHFFIKRKLFGHAFLSGQQVYGLNQCPKNVKPIKENDFLKFLILKELETWGKGQYASDHSIKVLESTKKKKQAPHPNQMQPAKQSGKHSNKNSSRKKNFKKKRSNPNRANKPKGNGNGNV